MKNEFAMKSSEIVKKHTLKSSYLNLNNTNNARYIDRDNENLRRYLKDVRKYKVLEPEEEMVLIDRYQKRLPGYEKAKEIIIGSHQRFIIMVAKRYRPCNIDLCDLINEGNVGLNVALNNYDSSFNTKFITFAGHYIVKYIFEFLENSGIVYQPNRSKIYGTANRVREDFFKEYGFYPSLDDLQIIFKERGMSIKNKTDFINIVVESMDKPVETNDDDYYHEYGYDDNIDERANTGFIRENVKNILGVLSDIERLVVTKVFGFDGIERTVSTIAFEMGTTEYKVKTHLDKAIVKMRKYKHMLE